MTGTYAARRLTNARSQIWLSTNTPSSVLGRGNAYQTSAVVFDCTRTSFTNRWRRCFRSGLELDSNPCSKSSSSRPTWSRSRVGSCKRSRGARLRVHGAVLEGPPRGRILPGIARLCRSNCPSGNTSQSDFRMSMGGRSNRSCLEGTPGLHRLDLEARDETGRALENGVYFVRMVAGERPLSRKLILM